MRRETDGGNGKRNHHCEDENEADHYHPFYDSSSPINCFKCEAVVVLRIVRFDVVAIGDESHFQISNSSFEVVIYDAHHYQHNMTRKQQ